MVRNDLAGDSRGGHVPPHIKVLCAIRTWARREIQDDAADIIGISQPTVSLVCKQVALALVVHRAQWIKMPQNDLEQNRVIAGFYGICGFRQVVGAIDCTHIRIPKVGGNIGQYYINRKGYSSINVQVVANANLEIMDIVAHWRGSTHDSRIFNECRLKRRFEQSEFKGRLLGDSALAILNNIAIHHRDMIENIDQPGNEDILVIPAINNNIRGNAARAAFINDNF
ncbi:putative nuclease HARBI1 [Diabrotica virgifera virgifera]|uniref:DDE Tnp4 domain-containing protein n=1 Tax=Diabrotica virgifera virgifera TaxID=50390 RepID=A0ABM5L1Q5_DIAVI|nr:putative nuclease HARBI1 [Diabrotica virgifera virgifera]